VLGVTLPDPALRFNEETGQYDMSEIDWDEFHEVLAGRGPANAERLRRRREAHEEGAWVREAAVAYASKQAAAASGAVA
jgi:ring-1,2-phenylacetyl-CoA epoxidase subunit PaaA